jgi:hypothetical protein
MAYRNLAEGLQTRCAAFDGDRLIAEGEAGEVALRVKALIGTKPDASILTFDDATSHPVEIDLEGSDEDVRNWIASWAIKPTEPSTGPGRPKLGVVAREVTLLPRQWEWLAGQPGGASVALRKLVDEARKANAGKDAARLAQESAYRFIVTMAGDLAGFEEASRALFANDQARFQAMTEAWPPDIRDRSRMLASRAAYK